MLAKQNQKAYEYLRRELLRGAFLPGTRLSDYALSKKINIGRGPIREAIGRLESEGFVEQIPRHGTFVRKLDRSEIEDLYDLRILLEGYAAERAAKRVSPEELEKLSTYCDEMRSLIHKLRDGEGDPVEHNKRMNELDYHFHSVTICAAGNRKIMKIVADQRVLALVTTSVIAHPERPTLRKLSEIWQSHLRVLRALRRGDGASARRWMERHIEKAKQRALRQYDEANPPCAASEQRTQAVLDMIEKLERYEG